MRRTIVKVSLGAMAVVVGALCLGAAARNELAEAKRLAQWANYAQQRANRKVPLPASKDQNQAQAISSQLGALLDKGRKAGVVLYRVDQSAVEQQRGRRTPFAERQRLPMFLDPASRTFVVSGAFEGEQLSGSTQLFYDMFFVAYAGLHSSFRSHSGPLARGVAALAALDTLYQTPLAALPDFAGETAAALLVVNADPAVIKSMTDRGPDDPELRRAVEVALLKGANDSGFAKDTAAILLGPDSAKEAVWSVFDLGTIMPKDASLRGKVRDYAVAQIYHPGAVAEFLRAGAGASGRELTNPECESLRGLFDDKVLTPLLEELTVRGVPKTTTGALSKAHFDTSVFLSAVRLLWEIEPGVKQWQGKARGLVAVKDVGKRNDQRRPLEQGLQVMFNDPAPSSRLGRLNALLAVSPSGPQPSQPKVDLTYEDRTATSEDPNRTPERYVESIQIILRWQIERSGPDRIDPEMVVFAGSDTVEAPGPPAPNPKPASTQPSSDDKAASPKPGPKMGPSDGQTQGKEGAGQGRRGQEPGGELPTPTVALPSDAPGIEPACQVRWKAGAEAQPSDLPVGSYREGLVATVILSPGRSAVSSATRNSSVWVEIVRLDATTSGTVVHLDLSNGRKLTTGALQLVLARNTAKQAWEWVQAKTVRKRDILFGENGAEVSVVSDSSQTSTEGFSLRSPTMAVYENLYVSGVLVKAGREADAGGLAPETQVEVPGGGVALAKDFTPETPIGGFLGDRPGLIPTLVRSNDLHKVKTLVELRYTVEGQPRVLRVAPNQDVVVYLPEQRLQTTAAACPEIKDPERAASRETAAAEEVLQLKPGMLLVAHPTAANEPPVCVPLESITAVTAKSAGQGAGAKASIETRILEIYNLGMVRAEGILVKVVTCHENIVGVDPAAMIVQPVQGTPPGAPMKWKEGDHLPKMVLSQMAPRDDPFLTTTWPAKTWLADRTTAKRGSQALRYVELVTDKGTLNCGNLQLIKALQTTADGQQKTIEIQAEKIVDDPGRWRLLFLDPDHPDPAGELTGARVKSARFCYQPQRVHFEQLVGNGLAERETVWREGKQKLLRKDIYLANGFLVVGVQEEEQGGGGSASGGGAEGSAGPDPSIGESITPIAFNLPGLGARDNPEERQRVRFSNDELARFNDNMRRLDAVRSSGLKWGRIKERPRLLRFLGVYFDSRSGKEFTPAEETLLVNRYAAAPGGGVPPWTNDAFQEYCKTRAVFLEHGSPADLYRLAFHYIFLVTLFYETANDPAGDALRDDFLCLVAHIALADYPGQKTRPEYYKDRQYRLGEALLWTRDVMFFIRDGRKDLFQQGVAPVSVAPAGWDALLKEKLAVLTGAGQTEQLIPSPGQVNLGNLWIQLHKYFHGVADQNAAFYSLVSPTQEPADMFVARRPFEEGPYAGQTIRQVLGVKSSTLRGSE